MARHARPRLPILSSSASSCLVERITAWAAACFRAPRVKHDLSLVSQILTCKLPCLQEPSAATLGADALPQLNERLDALQTQASEKLQEKASAWGCGVVVHRAP